MRRTQNRKRVRKQRRTRRRYVAGMFTPVVKQGAKTIAKKGLGVVKIITEEVGKDAMQSEMRKQTRSKQLGISRTTPTVDYEDTENIAPNRRKLSPPRGPKGLSLRKDENENYNKKLENVVHSAIKEIDL